MDPNLVRQSKRAFVSNLPAAPGNGATVVLFTSYPRAAGGSGAVAPASTFVRGDGNQEVKIDPDAIETVTVTWHKHDKASAANGLRAYKLDSEKAWVESDMKDELNVAGIGSAAPVQVPALSAGQEWREIFHVEADRSFCLEYTAGATGPTADTGWDLTIAVIYSEQEG